MDPLLELIEGIPPRKNLNRMADVEQNIHAVKSEFVGKPLICHELVKHIIYIRREIDLEKNIKKFYEYLDQYMDELLEHYDLRWLLSICDTLVDIGDQSRSASAMNLVQCVNYLNIMSTLTDICFDGKPDPTKLRNDPGHKRPTFDGMISLDIYHGDMMYNMQRRLNKIASGDELVNELWEEIKHRLVDDASVPVNWLTSVHREAGKKKFYHDDI